MFSKLRLSSHKLSIEKGRHSHPKIPEENRLCKVCGVIENEKHFLLHCDMYHEQRFKLLTLVLLQDEALLEGSSDQVFTKLMSCNDEKVIFSLCRFIQICFKKHDK